MMKGHPGYPCAHVHLKSFVFLVFLVFFIFHEFEMKWFVIPWPMIVLSLMTDYTNLVALFSSWHGFRFDAAPEAAKFLLGELQKEHHRNRLAAEAALDEQRCREHPEDQEQLRDHERQGSKSFNGFTLLLKDNLQSMVSWSRY